MSNTRWEQLLRYRLIEIVAMWEGRLTTRHLCDVFGIGRQQASKDINNYKRSIGPGNLEYDPIAKGYRPSADFAPKVSRGEAEEYLEIVAGFGDMQQILGQLPQAFLSTEALTAPRRHIPPLILRPLLQAARDHRRVDVDYVSLNRPNREGRVIVPHTLVWTGLRWHVRGWCEKNQDYRDFVLSRFRGEPDIMDSSEHTAENDSDWHKYVEVRIAPDPRLSEQQQQVVAHDFDMLDLRLSLRARARLLPYVIKLLQINLNPEDRHPHAQQIVILNQAELTPWLFDGT
ncbi:MAG: hypothetical protein CME57_01065 [Halieaceae bacterium]|mgnify:CR=1 FL=1|nr:hypothetical protein [Halieaceae bacterium]